MLLRTFIKRLERYYVTKSGSHTKVSYFRKLGMKIGENCHIYTMQFSTEPYLIEIGNDVAIAIGTLFITHDAGIRCFRDLFPKTDLFGKIKIGNNVFIGSNCTLLPNTIIGDNCVIGAGSVVRGKFPCNSVILGNPAKVTMNMNMLKLLYSKSKGRLKTGGMSDSMKKPIVIEHFKDK